MGHLAAGYDQFTTPITIPLAEEALRLVELRPGLRFLDVGAGSGALSMPAARLGAQVVAVDLSPLMVERLTERARHEGLTERVEGRVMDGHALDLPDDSFDVSGSHRPRELHTLDAQRHRVRCGLGAGTTGR